MFLSIGQSVNFIDICIFFSISSIISLLPITINGLGLKESALVFFLGKYSHVDSAVCMALLVLIQVVVYIIAVSTYLFFSDKKPNAISQ
jgi:uncharacterized membrane protein YbhN (UPF0104 family)